MTDADKSTYKQLVYPALGACPEELVGFVHDSVDAARLCSVLVSGASQ